jgi:hypothetical protein
MMKFLFFGMFSELRMTQHVYLDTAARISTIYYARILRERERENYMSDECHEDDDFFGTNCIGIFHEFLLRAFSFSHAKNGLG